MKTRSTTCIRIATLAGCLGVSALSPARTIATVQPVAPNFTESLVASGLQSPTAMAFAPDGRLFVAEQNGRLRVIKNGSLLATPFLTVSVDSSGERGLLGVTFDPAFQDNKYVYIYHTTRTSPRRNVVRRFVANGDIAQAGSETLILTLDSLSGATNHNGGAIHFGPDGNLYIAVGDNANTANAQSLGTRHGKILRINRDGSIPADNPFYSSATGANRAIWALGLRNPFTFAISRSGAMFINDVGQSAWEEVNDGGPGRNFGWPTTEGPTADPKFQSPRHAYSSSGSRCAITGGAFYEPQTASFPADYHGDYFFADYCSGEIYRLRVSTDQVETFATGINSPVDLRVGADGALYYLARDDGAVRAIRYGDPLPAITSHPQPATRSAGSSVTFSAAASGAPPLTYQWQRNGENISGATQTSYSISAVQASDNGARFRVVVSNSGGSVTSNEAWLTVTSNQPPVATIVQPASGAQYSAGGTITMNGTGSDPEDGSLGAGAFTWEVVFYHDTHVHPALGPVSGVSYLVYRVPNTGHTESNVYYRVNLTVRDSAGQTHTTYRDVQPRKVDISLATQPTGLEVALDGQPSPAPLSVTGVTGVVRSIGVVTPQTLGSDTYDFVSWSDGGAATHNITTPTANATYTATFRLRAATGCTAPPLAPTGLVWSRSGNTVTVSWTNPGGGADAPTSYNLEGGTAPGTSNLGVSTVSGSVTSVSGLAPPGTYYVRIKARNSCGLGPASDEIRIQ